MNYKDILELKNTTMKMHEIKIYSSNVEEVFVELKKMKKKVRNVIVNNPIILNFKEVSINDYNFIVDVYNKSLELEIKVIGIKNIKEKIKKELISNTKIPVFLNANNQNTSNLSNSQEEEITTKNIEEKSATNKSCVKVFNDVIRTGQKIEHDGDIFILSKVNSSSEIYATGSVFISAFVGGKIFAGVDLLNRGQGNSDSVIYIENFNANLVCINGVFKTFENIDKKYLGKRVRVYLEDEMIKIDLVENI